MEIPADTLIVTALRLLSIFAYLLSASICVAIGWYAWLRRPVPGAKPLALLAFVEAEWCLTYLLQLLSPSLEGKLFWNNAQFLGAVAVPLFYLAFGVEYNRRSGLLSHFDWRWLAPLSLAVLGLIWTDGAHHLFRVESALVQGSLFTHLRFTDGPLFSVFTVYAYTLIIVTTLLILVHYLIANHLYRLQIGVLLVGILIPWVTSMITALGWLPLRLHDATPLTFGLSNLVMAWALFRYHLFDLVPVARDLLIDSLQSGVIVLNDKACIMDVNPAGGRILGMSLNQCVGKPLSEVLPIPAEWFKLAAQNSPLIQDFKLYPAGQETSYEIQISSLQTASGAVIGQVVALSDISDRVRVQEKLRHLAITDDLTGLFNRRYFSLLANQELERALRYRHDLSIILLDIDFFKLVNDTHGHLVGDQVLNQLAQECFLGLRAFDISARFGGEEFIIALPETDLDAASQTAERLRARAEKLRVDTEQGEIQITISLGVASLSQSPGQTLNQLIDCADQALYLAKNSGRNQVRVWEENPQTAAA